MLEQTFLNIILGNYKILPTWYLNIAVGKIF